MSNHPVLSIACSSEEKEDLRTIVEQKGLKITTYIKLLVNKDNKRRVFKA